MLKHFFVVFVNAILVFFTLFEWKKEKKIFPTRVREIESKFEMCDVFYLQKSRVEKATTSRIDSLRVRFLKTKWRQTLLQGRARN